MGRRGFLQNNDSVEGLPVRLIVVQSIGVIALAAMAAALGNFKTQKTLSASVVQVGGKDGNMLIVSKAGYGQVNSTWTCKVTAVDSNGDPVEGASVVMYGLSGAGSDNTNKTGVASLTKTNDVVLNANQNSGYMTMEVTALGYNTYKKENAMIVVRAK